MRRKRAAGSRLRSLSFAAALLSCGVTADEASAPSPASTEPAEREAEYADHDAELAELVVYEEALRATVDHAHAVPWSRRAGADPIALLPDGPDATLGLLRAGRVVRLDADANASGEGDTLPGATGLVRAGGDLLVVAEGDGRIDVLDPSSLKRRRTIEVAGVASIRTIAFGEPERRVYLADPHRHRVLALAWPPPDEPDAAVVATEVSACGGALKVQRVGGWLAHACLLDHEVVVRTVAEDGSLGPPSAVRHDGPIWSFDAVPTDAGGLRLLLGGVEDRPLDRSDGAFGYIDSFAFVVEVEPGVPPSVRALGATNVSALGVVTPKFVAWREGDGGSPQAIVTGYGGDRVAILAWPDGLHAPARATLRAVPPGITALHARPGEPLRFVAADALLDAWLVVEGEGDVRVQPIAGVPDDRTPSQRLGEALAFTTLMAPGATSEGKRSRFTCETCHFEGRVDGRVHFTGRADVHATTKTLRGLFPNRPHFSRALDRTTAKMVNNEFTVANRGTGRDPWFSIAVREHAPWLVHLGVEEDRQLDPVALRRALIDFFAVFTPEPNPAVRGLEQLPADAREGAELFSRHCESCHAARLVADDPASRVPFAAWESLVLSQAGPIVWARADRQRTGVEPYVHPEGARVPSLRRLWLDRPYLTHGRARTLEDVLGGVRLFAAPAHAHDGRAARPARGPESHGRPPSADEIRALRAFLDLL